MQIENWIAEFINIALQLVVALEESSEKAATLTDRIVPICNRLHVLQSHLFKSHVRQLLMFIGHHFIQLVIEHAAVDSTKPQQAFAVRVIG